MEFQKETDRREKARFPIQRELRYRILEDTKAVQSGVGKTINMGSGGVAFAVDQDVKPGSFIELSISWPILLNDACPMRLVSYGRVLRTDNGCCTCTIDKYEFRTQARVFQTQPAPRVDTFFLRWADGMRKGSERGMLARGA